MSACSDEESITSGQEPSASCSYPFQESHEPMSSYDVNEDIESDDELPDTSVLDKKLEPVRIVKIEVKSKGITDKDNYHEAERIIKEIVRRRKRNNGDDVPSGPPEKIIKLERRQPISDGQDPGIAGTGKRQPTSTSDQQLAISTTDSGSEQSPTADIVTQSISQASTSTGPIRQSGSSTGTYSGSPDNIFKEIKVNKQIKGLLQESKYKLKLYVLETKQHSSFTRMFSDFVTKRGRKRLLREKGHGKSYILMFYRNINVENIYIPEIFAVTTGTACQQVKRYADKDFTKLVEKRTLAFSFQQVEYTLDSGPVSKEKQISRPGYSIVFSVWDYLDKLVGIRKRKPRENSSLFSFLTNDGKHVSSVINISENSMKIERKLSVVQLGDLLNHFSSICSKEKTYLVNENKDEETDDPMFEMLDLVAQVTDKSLIGELNETLYTVMKNSMKGVKSFIFLAHPSLEKWKISEKICLYARKTADRVDQAVKKRNKRKNIKTWCVLPSLDDVMKELHDYCGSDSFQPEWLEDVNIKFSSTTAPLKKFISSRFNTTRIGTYIYNHGVWMEMTGQYLYIIEKEIVDKIREYQLKMDGLPLLPWKHVGKRGDNGYQIQACAKKTSIRRWKKHFESVCKTGQFDKVKDEISQLPQDIPFDFETLKGRSKEQLAANLYYLLECNLNEDDYNAAHTLLNMLEPEEHIITCDKKTPHGIELCDILIAKGNTTYLVHVKAGFQGGPIREVCSQIRNAADNIFREQKISKGTGIISEYWDILTKPSDNLKTHENEVKRCLQKMTKETFEKLFHMSREIIFVLACRDIRKGTNFITDIPDDLEAKATDAIRGKFNCDINRSSPVIAKLTKEDYITDTGCLTNKFILEGKDNKERFVKMIRAWNEIKSPKMANDVFEALASSLSRSKSTIAKMEIIRLVSDFERYWIGENKFKFRIYSIGSDFPDV